MYPQFQKALSEIFQDIFKFKYRISQQRFIVFFIAMIFIFCLSLLIFPYKQMVTVLLVLLFPTSVRRMHDIGRSGWWVLIAHLAGIFIVFLWFYLLFMPTQKFENKYGSIPTRF